MPRRGDEREFSRKISVRWAEVLEREDRAEREVLEAKREYLQRLGRETSLLVDKGDIRFVCNLFCC